MSLTAIYPGTFDPITNGHLDIIERATHLFDHLVVAVAISARKSPMLSLQQRVSLVQVAVKKFKNVEVNSYSGLLVEFAKQKKAKTILRGLRAITDFENELQLAGMNQQLAPTIETLFMAASSQYAFISSTLVREVATMGGDVSLFVPKEVANALKKMKF